MKKLVKIFSLIMTVCLLCGIIAVAVSAATPNAGMHPTSIARVSKSTNARFASFILDFSFLFFWMMDHKGSADPAPRDGSKDLFVRESILLSRRV